MISSGIVTEKHQHRFEKSEVRHNAHRLGPPHSGQRVGSTASFMMSLMITNTPLAGFRSHPRRKDKSTPDGHGALTSFSICTFNPAPYPADS
jgi:hypothetical protein